jgi:hypothetical protein
MVRPTKEENVLQTGMLGATFCTYWDDMDKCRSAKAYWSLLHVTACLPDICAALQSKNGETNRNKYISWYDQFLQDPMLSGAEMYRMRCKVLHEGRAKTGQPGRYSNFSFGQPSDTGVVDHKRKANGVLHVDVGELAREIRDAVERWIETLEGNPNSREAITVEKNLGSLVRVSRVSVPISPTQSVIFNKTN